jgi:hypothetical protein
MSGQSQTLVLLVTLGLADSARAQEAASPPAAEVASPTDVSPAMARDLARLEALIPAFAAQARTARLAVGGIFIATGLVAVPVGIVAQASWHEDYGIGLWVGGALLLGLGTLSLVWESPLEKLDHDFQASAATLAPAQRLAYGAGGLASVAASARSGRMVGAVLDFVCAGIFYGIAIGELVSASNNVGSDRSNLQAGAASSLMVGGIFTGLAVVQLVLPSPAETAYAVYASGAAPSTGGLHLSGGVAPLRGGGMLALGGRF